MASSKKKEEDQRLAGEARLKKVGDHAESLGYRPAWSRGYSGGIAVELLSPVLPEIAKTAPDLLLVWRRDGHWMDVYAQVCTSNRLDDLLRQMTRLTAPPVAVPGSEEERLTTALRNVAQIVSENEAEILGGLLQTRTTEPAQHELAKEIREAMKEWRDATQAFLESLRRPAGPSPE